MATGKFKITKKEKIKGEDGNKVISIRIKNETVDELDKISKQTGRSRNEIINILLEESLKNIEVE